MSRCSKLTSLPESIGNLHELTSLNLSSCYDLDTLPDSIQNLSKLTSLNLSGSLVPRSSISKRLYVTNLDFTTSVKTLRKTFETVGAVEDVVISSRNNYRSLECGFVTMATREDAEAALDKLNHHSIDGRRIFVSFASLKYRDNNLHKRELLDTIGRKLSTITSLDLSANPTLTRLPDSIGTLSNLTSLNLSGCTRLEPLPRSMAHLTELRSLVLSGKLRVLPRWFHKLQKLTSLSFHGCHYLQSLPQTIGNLSNLTSLHLRGCGSILSLPSSIGNLSKLTSLDLTGCSKLVSLPKSMTTELRSLGLSGQFTSVPMWVCELQKLTSLSFFRCAYLESLPESIGNLTHLHSLDLSRCENLVSLPESIGNLTHLHSLALSRCYALESLPESIGNLSNLTSLILSGCSNLRSLPTTLHNLTHLTTPLSLANVFTLPSDLDWSQFQSYVTIPLYLEYMMKTNKFDSIISKLGKYMKRFNQEHYSISMKQLLNESTLIERREGGNSLIGYLCLMLTNDWKMKSRSGSGNQILEWTSEKNKTIGLKCLKILFMNVYRKEMKRETLPLVLIGPVYIMVPTGRRMLEVWKDEGKDEEGRREWERRWREVGDIMNEEDVMETSIMHLCIPDYRKKERTGVIIPSGCSYNALSILLNEKSDRECAYHF